MPEIRYEVVTDAPVEEILALYRAAGWWTEGDRGSETIHGILLGSLVFVVAVEDGRIVGMARALSDGVSDAWIQDVTVLPSHRRRGIGARLVERVTEACLARGVTWVGLVAETGTESFYGAIGYGRMTGTPMRYGIEDEPGTGGRNG
ncbi:MAG: GNAT family N-acetyltransferase [Deltaproteobacteria bacterium]|nr:GNAT family N-acetyltransferase [Deltaproteobacteria bacterium]